MHASEFLCIPLQWSSLGGMSNAFPLRRPAVVCWQWNLTTCNFIASKRLLWSCSPYGIWKLQQTTYTKNNLVKSPCSGRGNGLGDLSRLLPIPIILWFCEIYWFKNKGNSVQWCLFHEGEQCILIEQFTSLFYLKYPTQNMQFCIAVLLSASDLRIFNSKKQEFN